uniref:Pecanex-like protein n=1 Tax=Macrostomum lignano TaxID=282301 RepID=A0A1I8G3J7_9PLAT
PLACQLVAFNSDTLVRVYCLRYSRYACPLHSCPANYTPVLSRCGSRIAYATNFTYGSAASSGTTSVAVASINSTVGVAGPPGLAAGLGLATGSTSSECSVMMWPDQYLCNQVLLPRRLQSYLKFLPDFTCAGSCLSRSSSTATSY